MVVLKFMRFVLIILAFLVTFFPVYINISAFATEIQANDLEHLKPYDISFLIRADLNNDAKEEKVTIFRQWDGEGWWSDDQWYIICIFDENGDILYKKDVSYFQEVGSFAVKDRDGDGLKEVIVSLEQAQCWDAKTQIYGWKEDSYNKI
ncbi:hypothetical protein KKC91_04325 [bacterium]|nr:hypothetical protein [bacterium]MBU1853680.1 hypothetical protein [Candidatus Omnitrophota bacterium]